MLRTAHTTLKIFFQPADWKLPATMTLPTDVPTQEMTTEFINFTGDRTAYVEYESTSEY